ncbi:hypothetical protein HQ45_05795 [Porphyromonas crevioricanis]|uniref:Uncharacterized protein n=1 Tax=Porphyromonas crevioricanis TaxID=393921 RepID=A0AB34PG97_9PORP|nr:hypothetical protein HQ45_05795 [Porphyromonas crevioricanis]KGN95367.1 hypothetical protein HQ38_03540 [Porphyromonas crevioricanis]GAD08088.1 hypothetical protein PORCAN_1723 [Porphyromonas crevioricanis JCM 13913]
MAQAKTILNSPSKTGCRPIVGGHFVSALSFVSSQQDMTADPLSGTKKNRLPEQLSDSRFLLER